MNKLNFKNLQTKKENLSQTYLRLLMVLMVLPMAFVNAWGGSPYNTALRAIVAEEDTGKGLVYASNNTDATPDYKNIVKSDNNAPEDQNIWTDFYAWAQPARGYKFSKWVFFDFFTIAGYAYEGNGSIETESEGDRRGREAGSGSLSIKANTGTHDNIKGKSWGGGAGDDVCVTVKATWLPATSYVVTYKQPKGGNYTVSYSYQTVNPGSSYFAGQDAFTTSTETLNLDPSSGDKRPFGASDGSQEGNSYAADVVTLSTTDVDNFAGWEENGVVISTDNPYTYPITKAANVKALFKWIEPIVPEKKIIRTTNNSADVNESVVLTMDNVVADWATADFTVTFVNADGSGTFTAGEYSYNATDGELTIPFTYNANGHWEEGSNVTIQVVPTNGTSVAIQVLAIAQENSANQARVSGEGFATQEGDLTDMLAIANTKTDATLTLLQSVAVSSPLVVTASMTLDLNNWVLSSTAANKIISVEGTDTKLTIVDNSYLKGSEIQLTRNTNTAIAAIEVTGANRLLYNHGKITVVNNAEFASNANAKAYGIYVSGAGNAVMQSGSIKVESDHDARGVFIASGNATLNVGKIVATAKSQAYALYSGGKINVAEGISLTATTTTGSDASAFYLTGGTAVVDNVAMTATTKTNNAFGVNVQGGKLTLNGGVIAAKATTAGVYGVYIASTGNVTIQQQATITADGPGSSALPVFGIQNLGTLRLINSSVTATSTTNYATAVSSMTSATSTTIEGGTYTAQSAAGYAYGLHHQYGVLSVDGGTFSAIAAGDKVYGARAAVDGTIANATLLAESTDNGNTVYGFVGGVANKNVSLTNCTIKAKSATSAAYAIYTRANVTATGCTLEAKTLSGATACGFYAENGTNVLNNTNATVKAYTTDAYGVKFIDGTLTVDGGTYDVTSFQTTAIETADSKVYGVHIANSKTAILRNATFNVSAPNNSFSRKAYGVYTGSGTCNSMNCTYDVSVATQAYGIYAEGSSTLNLSNDNITATTNISSTAYGIYSNGGFTINENAVISHTRTYTSYPLVFGASAHGEVLGGKFKAEGAVPSSADQVLSPVNKTASASNVAIKGGFFYDIPNVRYYVPDGYDIYGVDPGATEYAQGYYFTVNDHLPYENICYITEANTGFPTLAEAFDYARNHTNVNCNIIMTQPYTLPEGNYLLPSNAILVVPYMGTQTTARANDVIKTRGVKMIAENRCLTLAANANIDVQGAIEASADILIDAAGSVGYVQGPYGRIHMASGSTITLNSGANLYAYGYITGQGEIRVKNGATVYEDFQMHDMKGAKDMDDNWVDNAQKTFPVNQYYIQNIEVPTKYYYGAKLYGKFGYVAANMTVGVQDVEVLGTSTSFFHVDTDDESSWVRKSYNPTTDRILWETNSSASLGSMGINISGYSFNSKDYILPLTNNMTIHALSGKFTITQSTVMLPGSEIILDKTATLQINEKDGEEEAMGLYLYDQAQWSTAAKPIKYSPSWPNGTCPRNTAASSMADAAIYVKGRVEVDGFIHTTSGGAAIYSDDTNAGTIVFNADAMDDKTIYKTYASNTNVTTTSAQLRNGGVSGGSFTATKGIAAAGDAYAYMDIDEDGVYTWTNLATIEGDECVVKDKNTGVYYAKPQGYVAITSDTEDENHLFHSVTGSRLFIQQLMDAGCQWWEVTQVGETSVYYCASNNTYYEYDDTTTDSWIEVKRTVTFYFTDPKSEEADKKKVLTVNYGAKPDVSIVSNPSKAEDAAATYQFQGWKYGEDGPVHAYTDLESYEPVTENDTYYLPVFTSITKKYTITLNDAKNGDAVPVEVFYGSVPEYTATKAATAEFTYTFDHWEPALAEVTGPATYTAYWTSVKNRYNITWVNGETTLEEDKNVLYGAATSYDGAAPTKATDDDFVYAFSGWLSSLDGNTYANGSTPTVAGHTTYTAQYNTTPRYAITFANYDGSQLQKESVTQGEHPAYDEYKYGTPARVRDVDGYYKFTGWKDLSGTFYAKNATLPVVTDHKETYTAQYDYVTELYLITLRNVKGQGAAEGDNIWSGKFGVGATPFYDPNGDDIADVPAKTGDAQYSYAFDGWSLTQDGDKIDPMPEVEGTATYWALFAQSTNKYTITFANVDGNGAEETVEVEYGQTPVCPVTPAKGDNYYTYDFLGWDNTIVAVTGDATYTAQFGEGVARTFTITFEPENGGAAEVLSVAYGQMPAPTIPSKTADVQYTYAFDSWYPTLSTVTEDATYYAQYTQTLNRYAITFLNYDGTELQSASMNYGLTPSYAETPIKPMDLENRKMYSFSGWKNTSDEVFAKDATLPSVTKVETYTAQYFEQNIVASVTTSDSKTSYKTTFDEAYNEANSTGDCIIKLYANITEADNSTRSLSSNMTIDLNGYTISEKHTNTTAYYIYINSGITLTINDSRGGGKIYFKGTGNTNYYTVDVHSSSGVLTVNGGTIEAKNTYNSTSRWAAVVQVYNSNSTVNVYGGELVASATTGKSYTVKHDGSGYGYAKFYGGKLKAGTDIIGDAGNASRNNFSGGYYSKAPNGSYTLGEGKGVCEVREEEPEKAEGYDYKVVNAHTITFKDGNNATVQSKAAEDGYVPVYEGDTPTKQPDGRIYEFAGTWSPALAVVDADATYTAQFNTIGIEVGEGDDPLEITEDLSITTTKVETNGTLAVADGKTLTTTNLILEASESASGQIKETGTITATNVYYDLKLNTNARHWHAFGVPWAVNLNTNPLTEVETGRTLVLGRDYDIIWYSTAKRATNGPGAHCWEYVEHNGKTLTPGQGYMIAFTSAVQSVRFVKADGAPIIYNQTVNVSGAGTGDDQGINALANPMAYHATLGAGPTVGYVHDGGEIGSDGYDEYNIEDKSYIVGKAVYIQVDSDKPVVVAPSDADPISPVLAPARRKAAAAKQYLSLSDYYHVSIASATTNGGSVYVLPEEDKEDKYVIGHDLAKFGMNSKKPQLWVNRYDTKLGLNTTEPINEVAEFPVSVYAPNAGEYTISLASQPDDEYTVYLMRNGIVIWDLSSGAYVANLEAGVDKTYGLRLSARKSPSVATGVDEAVVDAQGEIKKVIINDKVFIIRGENVYTIDGQLVK